MDRSSSDAFQKDSTPPLPSAPPYPTATTATRIPINMTKTNSTSSSNSNLVHSKSHSPLAGRWSTGLCDCCSDVNSCCLTCWCPCITFGRIAEMTDRGSTSCGVSGALYAMILCVSGCACLYSCFYRSKLRGQYFLRESPCTDCCIHCCCEECALCQEYRELQNHGFDMSIGWHGNMERQKREAVAAIAMAPVAEGMTR